MQSERVARAESILVSTNRILKNFVCVGTMLCDASERNVFERSANVPRSLNQNGRAESKTGSLNRNVSHAQRRLAMHVPPQQAMCCREHEEFRFGNYHCTV
jgi:hypothetical protein